MNQKANFSHRIREASREADSRPRHDWTQLFGLENSRDQIKKQIHEQRLPQVLLFEGREGIGKSLLIAEVAAYLLCDTGDACGHCGSCRDIQSEEHPELLWLSTDKYYRLEDAASLQEHLEVMSSGLFASQGKSARIAVMLDIDRLSLVAANRLLKTLEEPQAGSFIFLSTSHWGQLLATIRSRVVRWHIAPPAIPDSLQWLEQQFRKLNATPSEDQLQHALLRTGLSPGLAYRFLQRQLEDPEYSLRQAAIGQLIEGNQISSVLQASQDLARQFKLSLNELADELELLLNQYYKRRVQVGVKPDGDAESGKLSIDWGLVLHRRRILQELRRAGVHKKIPLNVQLAANSLGVKQ